VGFSIGNAKDDIISKEGGDLQAGTFYVESAKWSAQLIKVDSRYYLTEPFNLPKGYSIGGSFAFVSGETEYSWGRYDNDPAFIIIGNGRRLQAAGGNKEAFQSSLIQIDTKYTWSIDRLGFQILGSTPYALLDLGAGLRTFLDNPVLNYLEKGTVPQKISTFESNTGFDVFLNLGFIF